MSRKALHIFEGYGIEMEYMIIREDNYDVMPVCDLILEKAAGKIVNEIEMGELSWSNELVLHVIELKTNGPVNKLVGLENHFLNDIKRINTLLKPMGGKLLPTAMHPFMKSTKIWPHENNEIYDTYNRIFDCKGHGWSNLQSVHINLPFQGDDEFGKLHAAIRLVLPILPALAASSPIIDEKITGFKDNRLEVYRNNQKKIPEITGRVIPEPVFTASDYQKHLLEKIYSAIAPFDPDDVLQEEWLNSRGAIARFERNTIEIRVLDIQETPLADVAIASFIITLIRALTDGFFLNLEEQKKIPTDPLADLFINIIRYGEDAIIDDTRYLSAFGISGKCTAGEFWGILLQKLLPHYPELSHYKTTLEYILQNGSLSSRIIKSLENDLSRENIIQTYQKLSICLEKGELFKP